MTRLFIPHLKVISPNRRGHWRKLYNQTKKNKETVHWYLKTIEKPALPVKVTMTRISPREYDDDNLTSSMKEIRDKVADWLIPGLAPGRADSDERITWVYEQRKGQPKEIALEITFT